METTIMENQMEKKMENEMETLGSLGQYPNYTDPHRTSVIASELLNGSGELGASAVFALARGEVTLVYPKLRNPYDGKPANADLQAQVLLRVLLYCPKINSKTHGDVRKAAIPILSNPYTTKKLQAAPTICKHNKASVTSLCGGSTKQEYGALNYKLLQPEKARITSLCIDDQGTPTATPKPEHPET